jgi:predicted RNase H-like nuclease (RuvC/YqgF family)
MISLSPVTGQDIRGMEVCTAEKQLERRTACLQANIEFLQQALIKLDRETRDRIATADRDLSDARREIAALKSTIEKQSRELTQMNPPRVNAQCFLRHGAFLAAG